MNISRSTSNNYIVLWLNVVKILNWLFFFICLRFFLEGVGVKIHSHGRLYHRFICNQRMPIINQFIDEILFISLGDWDKTRAIHSQQRAKEKKLMPSLEIHHLHWISLIIAISVARDNTRHWDLCVWQCFFFTCTASLMYAS